MGKRIVIALGGNALGKTISEQAEVVKGTAKAVAGLVRAGHQVVISHGNGPQVGMIQKAMTACISRIRSIMSFVRCLCALQ